jgi:hypothetical protein
MQFHIRIVGILFERSKVWLACIPVNLMGKQWNIKAWFPYGRKNEVTIFLDGQFIDSIHL